MTIPFLRKAQNGDEIELVPFFLISAKLVLEETGKLCERVEVSAFSDTAVPHRYVRRTFFQAQMNVGLEPRKLIFGETDYSFFSERPVPACFLK